MLFLHLLVRFYVSKNIIIFHQSSFFLLETSPFVVTPLTKLPSSPPLSLSSSSLLLLPSFSMSTSPSWSLSSLSSLLSLIHHRHHHQFRFTFLRRQEFVCHLRIWIHLCFFKLFVFYYLLALDVIFCWQIFILVFLKNFQDLLCAITLTVDWC